MSTVYVTPAQVAAAKALMILDKAEHRPSDEWTVRVANAVDEDDVPTQHAPSHEVD